MRKILGGLDASVAKPPKRYGKGRKKKHVLRNRLIYIFSAFFLLLMCFLVYSHLSPTLPDQTPKAAIVDHLSVQWPNPVFLGTVEEIIGETGLPVDYFPSEEVTVDFYRNLPLHNYKLIIFRVHSTGEPVEGQPPFVVFFSSEVYSGVRHVSDQMAMRVVYVNFPEPHQSDTGFFGITPTFIRESMRRRFNDTVIIAMGCDGLMHTTMAEAFIEKGAKAYIGWNGPVSAGHTDQATTRLLHYLIVENRTIDEAVRKTMDDVGPDLVDKSTLSFYPKTAETRDYVIPRAIVSLNTHQTSVNMTVSSHANGFQALTTSPSSASGFRSRKFSFFTKASLLPVALARASGIPASFVSGTKASLTLIRNFRIYS